MNNFSKYEDNLNLIGPILKDKRIEKGLSLEKFSGNSLSKSAPNSSKLNPRAEIILQRLVA